LRFQARRPNTGLAPSVLALTSGGRTHLPIDTSLSNIPANDQGPGALVQLH